MIRFIRFMYSFLALLFIPISLLAFQQQGDEIYRQGMKAKEAGNYEKALEIWISSRAEVPQPDLKIATAYLDLVTEQQMRDKYELGNLMYNWGLSAEDVSYNREALKWELEHIAPLMDKDETEEMQKLLEDENPEIYQAIKKFWGQMDPTPGSVYNERLIEHRERLTYAKEHFSYGRSNDKELDARAELFLKIGPPDRRHSGTLTYQPGTVSSLLKTQISRLQRSPGYDRETATIVERAIESSTREYATNPEYEVWVYENLDEQENIIYMFGNTSAGRKFDEMRSVEDFIPASAFNFSNRNRIINLRNNNNEVENRVDTAGTSRSNSRTSRGIALNSVDERSFLRHGITPALILELLYYEQLSHIDNFFGNIYSRLNSDLNNVSTSTSTSMARQYKAENQHEISRKQALAPAEYSRYEEVMADVNVNAHPYRFLNEQNQPYVALFVESNPYQAFLNDYINNRDKADSTVKDKEILKNVKMVHHMEIRDKDWNLITQSDFNPNISIDIDNNTAQANSLYNIPYGPPDATIVVSAEYHNTNPESDNIYEATPFPHHVRGVGKASLNYPPPLNSNEFEISDLILGYDKREESDLPYPFVVSHDQKIPSNENLVFHFEAYNLTPNNNGIHPFKIHYKVSRKSGKIRNLLINNDDLNVFLTLIQESEKRSSTQTIELETSRLEVGEYTIEIQVEDRQTGEIVSRSKDFEITANSN